MDKRNGGNLPFINDYNCTPATSLIDQFLFYALLLKVISFLDNPYKLGTWFFTRYFFFLPFIFAAADLESLLLFSTSIRLFGEIIGFGSESAACASASLFKRSSSTGLCIWALRADLNFLTVFDRKLLAIYFFKIKNWIMIPGL